MSTVSTSTVLMTWGCGHFGWLVNGDRLPSACPACYPPPGDEPWNLKRGVPVWHVVDGAVQTVATFSDRLRAQQWASEQEGDLEVLSTPTLLDLPEA